MAGTSSHVSAGVWLLRATRPPWLRRITWNHLENHFTIQTLTLKKRSFKSHLPHVSTPSVFGAAQPGPSPFQTPIMVSSRGPAGPAQVGAASRASASRGRIWGPGRRSAPGVQVRWNAPTRPGSPRWQVVAEKRLLIFLVSERVKDADWKIFFGG